MLPTLQDISNTTFDLILNEPFYGHFFTGILKRMDEQAPSLALRLAQSDQIELTINPHYWQSLSVNPALQYGAIKHELLHLVLKHPFRLNEFANKKLFHIATDLVVNQFLKEEQMLPDAILLNDFEALDLAPLQDVAYYYNKLNNTIQQKPKEKQPAPPPFARLNELLTSPNERLAQHQQWESTINQLSKPEKDILQDQLNMASQSAANRAGKDLIGTLPDQVIAQLKALERLQNPPMNWRRILRLFTHSSRRTYLKSTNLKPSKRYGTQPGIKIRNKQQLLVAIDTSRSLKMDDLSLFFNEIHQIWRQGIAIEIVECDVVIHNQYGYKGHLPDTIKGRGGTAFDAPIELANTQLNPDAIIYFTDGKGAPPKVKSRYPLLWVISRDGINLGDAIWISLPGRKVKML